MLAFLLILLFVYNKRPNNSKSLLYLPSAALTLATQGSTSHTGNATSKDIDVIWRHCLAGALRVTYHKRR